MQAPTSEYEVGVPHPRLRPFVTQYTGYRLAGFSPGVHVGLPSRSLTCVVAFDEPLEVAKDLASEDRRTTLPPPLEQAWSRLRASHGAVTVAELADEVGWSRRHLGEEFRKGFGFSPKVMARILRFERAQSFLRLPTRPSLASVAYACGYADQSHLTRDWREFAGASPTEWLRDEQLPFVQDDRDQFGSM